MKVWVDADACPKGAKELIFRLAKRRQLETILVANSAMRVPSSPWILLEVVGKGFDVADDFIADQVSQGDLVITADIPLAARIVEKGAVGLDPRGTLYDEDNVAARLATRNLLAQLRDEGVTDGGPPPYKPKDKNLFASALDRQVTKMLATQQD